MFGLLWILLAPLVSSQDTHDVDAAVYAPAAVERVPLLGFEYVDSVDRSVTKTVSVPLAGTGSELRWLPTLVIDEVSLGLAGLEDQPFEPLALRAGKGEPIVIRLVVRDLRVTHRSQVVSALGGVLRRNTRGPRMSTEPWEAEFLLGDLTLATTRFPGFGESGLARFGFELPVEVYALLFEIDPGEVHVRLRQSYLARFGFDDVQAVGLAVGAGFAKLGAGATGPRARFLVDGAGWRRATVRQALLDRVRRDIAAQASARLGGQTDPLLCERVADAFLRQLGAAALPAPLPADAPVRVLLGDHVTATGTLAALAGIEAEVVQRIAKQLGSGLGPILAEARTESVDRTLTVDAAGLAFALHVRASNVELLPALDARIRGELLGLGTRLSSLGEDTYLVGLDLDLVRQLAQTPDLLEQLELPEWHPGLKQEAWLFNLQDTIAAFGGPSSAPSPRPLRFRVILESLHTSDTRLSQEPVIITVRPFLNDSAMPRFDKQFELQSPREGTLGEELTIDYPPGFNWTAAHLEFSGRFEDLSSRHYTLLPGARSSAVTPSEAEGSERLNLHFVSKRGTETSPVYARVRVEWQQTD